MNHLIQNRPCDPALIQSMIARQIGQLEVLTYICCVDTGPLPLHHAESMLATLVSVCSNLEHLDDQHLQEMFETADRSQISDDLTREIMLLSTIKLIANQLYRALRWGSTDRTRRKIDRSISRLCVLLSVGPIHPSVVSPMRMVYRLLFTWRARYTKYAEDTSPDVDWVMCRVMKELRT